MCSPSSPEISLAACPPYPCQADTPQHPKYHAYNVRRTPDYDRGLRDLHTDSLSTRAFVTKPQSLSSTCASTRRFLQPLARTSPRISAVICKRVRKSSYVCLSSSQPHKMSPSVVSAHPS